MVRRVMSTKLAPWSGLIGTPLASAAVPDFAFPEIEGRRPPDLDRMLKFRRALNRLTAADPAVHQQILEVQHLIKPTNAFGSVIGAVSSCGPHGALVQQFLNYLLTRKGSTHNLNDR